MEWLRKLRHGESEHRQGGLRKRQNECQRLVERYPDRLPIIFHRSETSALPQMKKYKYLMTKELRMDQVKFIVRKALRNHAEDLKLYVETVVDPNRWITLNSLVEPHQFMTLKSVFEQYKSEDGFLYITYV